MATTDAGLQKLTLQTSYEKLVIGALESGVAGDMSMVTTSQGQAAAPSVLYLGAFGDGVQHPLMKIKAANTSGKFLSIATKNGDEKQGQESGGEEKQILSFTSDSGNEGKAILWQKLQLNTLNKDLTSGARIEFVPSENVSEIQKYPTIHGAQAGNSIQFEMGYETHTASWQIDRLKIAVGDNGAGSLYTTNVIPNFDATGVTCTLGDTTVASMNSAGAYVHNGTSFTIDTSANVDITALGDCLVDGKGTAKFRATGESGDVPNLYLDAIATDADSTQANIHIGTSNQAGAYGATVVNIGPASTRTGTSLNLNSEITKCENGFIAFKSFASGSSAGADGTLVPDTHAALYAETAGSKFNPFWHDSSDNTTYEIDKVQTGKSRTSSYTDITGSSTTSPTVGAVKEAVQYMKDGKLIFKYNNTNSSTYYVYIDLDAATTAGALTNPWTVSTTEP